MTQKLWLRPEVLKAINDDPKILSLLYDLNLLPEVILVHLGKAVQEERNRIADRLEKQPWANTIPLAQAIRDDKWDV